MSTSLLPTTCLMGPWVSEIPCSASNEPIDEEFTELLSHLVIANVKPCTPVEEQMFRSLLVGEIGKTWVDFNKLPKDVAEFLKTH